MSDSADFGDFDYSRLRRWTHAPKNLIRQSVKFYIRYFGAAIIQSSLQDQNIIDEAVKNLCGARDMKAGSKLNVKKLPKLDLEIDYSKLTIHTEPNTIIQLSQIVFCEKSKVSDDNKAFQYLAFVVNEDMRNTAYLFVCSNEIANSIKKTYEQLLDMHILHTNCNVIRNAVKQIGCGSETSKKVEELWQSRDEIFKDAVNRIQVEMTRQFPLVDESLKKLTDPDSTIDKEVLQEHARLVNELKQTLIQAVRYSQSVAMDSNEFIKQQLDSCLNPQLPAIKPTCSPNASIDSPMSFKNNHFYDFSSSQNSNNMYEVPRPIPSPRKLDGNHPMLPTTPVPKIPVVYRTLPTRAAARKKSPAKTLFNTLKPKPRTKISTFMSETNAISELSLEEDGFVDNNNSPSTSKEEPFILEKNANEQNSSNSTYYEGTLGNWPKLVLEPKESEYYEGTINPSKDQSEDPYYFCPMPTTNTPTLQAPLPPIIQTTSNIRVIVERAEGSQSESSASQRDSVRESNIFEDDEPEAMYITHQQANHYD